MTHQLITNIVPSAHTNFSDPVRGLMLNQLWQGGISGLDRQPDSVVLAAYNEMTSKGSREKLQDDKFRRAVHKRAAVADLSGDVLRLATEVQTMIRSTDSATMASLGEPLLKKLRDALKSD